MRRYELMIILRADVADDRSKAIQERTLRSITESGGRIIKDVPWGRRRLAYEIGGAREGIYQIIVFEAPSSAVAELERVLLITEEVVRHLVIRDERKNSAARDAADEEAAEEAAADAAAAAAAAADRTPQAAGE